MRLPLATARPASAHGDVELIAGPAHFHRVVRDGICRAKVSIDIMTADFKAMLVPQPGLDGLDALLDEIGRAGLPVELHVEGQPFPLPRGIDLSAYRIVQEGLTNVLKHAHASDADVIVRYRPDELRIEVRDNGRGRAASDGLGHGLVGVRERVKIYGGQMSAGTSEDGGFVLTTRLPLDGEGP